MTWRCLILLSLVGTAALAYDQKIHVFLSKRSYGGPTSLLPAPEEASTPRALRELIWRAGSNHPDAEVRRRFLLRYPDLARFDAWEWKRFLALNPDKPVVGLDDAPLTSGSDPSELFALASRLPDDDHRNRARFRHDEARKVLFDQWGKPLPDDPATLEMGSLDGLSSQAHAHYGLPKLEFSDDPDVLKNEPRRFAIPPTVHTFGADFAETYSQLAVLAGKLPGGSRLALIFAGAAAHHVQDVANQIHTVQVGIYDFFVDAKIESIKEDLRSLGGILRTRPTFVSIGIDIIANHHTLLEYLFGKHLFAPNDPVARLAEHAPADETLSALLATVPSQCQPAFGRSLTEHLIERSSHEGAAVYAAIRKVADRKLSRVGNKFDETQDPDPFIQPGADLSQFYDLQVRGARRADQTMTAWWKHFNVCMTTTDDAVITRFAATLVRNRIGALDAQDERVKTFTPKPPTKAEIAWWVPALYASLLAAVVGIVVLLRRRRSRRATRP
jgi:hypothetical protein